MVVTAASSTTAGSLLVDRGFVPLAPTCRPRPLATVDRRRAASARRRSAAAASCQRPGTASCGGAADRPRPARAAAPRRRRCRCTSTGRVATRRRPSPFPEPVDAARAERGPAPVLRRAVVHLRGCASSSAGCWPCASRSRRGAAGSPPPTVAASPRQSPQHRRHRPGDLARAWRRCAGTVPRRRREGRRRRRRRWARPSWSSLEEHLQPVVVEAAGAPQRRGASMASHTSAGSGGSLLRAGDGEGGGPLGARRGTRRRRSRPWPDGRSRRRRRTRAPVTAATATVRPSGWHTTFGADGAFGGADAGRASRGRSDPLAETAERAARTVSSINQPSATGTEVGERRTPCTPAVGGKSISTGPAPIRPDR